MRDPNQLELDFGNQQAPQMSAERDQQVKLSGARQAVLTYCWHVLNGHRVWADSYVPETSDMQELLDHLEANTDAFGQQYKEVLRQLLRERIARLVLDCHKLLAPFIEEELNAGVHASQQVRV